MVKWLLGIWVPVCLLAAGCTQPNAVQCGGGRWCPQDTKCGPQPKYECLRTNCGDGIVQKDEPCDGDGKGQPGETATCNLDCTWARCGDGIKNVAAGEQCDGNDNGEGGETATCNLDCTTAKHGDGKVNKAFGEDCDGDIQGHGNGHDCQSPICNADCTVSKCGDGRPNIEAGERCDDGNQSNEDDCLNDCQPNVCGDGFVNRLHEGCDDGPLNDRECDYGQRSCDVCHACEKRVKKTGRFCGDGHPDPEEECDPGSVIKLACDYDTRTCEGCSVECKTVSLTGPYCGDGITNGQEACDDKGKTAMIFANGACPYGIPSCWACSKDCSQWKSFSGPYCGDGTKNGDSGEEECDDPRSVACGTCGAPDAPKASVRCKNVTGTLGFPQGTTTIIVTDVATLRGQTVSYDDGEKRLTFEFVNGGDPPLTDGNLPVKIDASGASGTARNLWQAIVDQQMMFTVGAVKCTAANSPPCALSLIGRKVSSEPIQTGFSSNAPDGGSLGIGATGMSEGFGCISGAPCARPEDCASNRCLNGFCD